MQSKSSRRAEAGAKHNPKLAGRRPTKPLTEVRSGPSNQTADEASARKNKPRAAISVDDAGATSDFPQLTTRQATRRLRTGEHPMRGRDQTTPGDKSATVADLPAQTPTITVEPIIVNDGVVSLTGYGIRIAVRNGQLELADGLGPKRRAGRFSRATCGITRLVVRGPSFFITGEAVRWLTDVGASFLNLGWDGEIVAHWSQPGIDDARLRRAQALAPWTETGLTLTRYLLREKLLGQARNLESMPDAAAQLAEHRAWLAALEAAEDMHAVRAAEGRAAAAYWSAWESVPVQWVRRDEPRIPEHWQQFGPRLSPVSQAPRQAATPGNALLNYLYSILEAETVTACRTIGLDAGMGLLHTDKANRQSLALDVMEPVRPLVDAWLYRTLQNRVFTWDDFGEVRDGVCRILPPLTHALSETAPDWYRAVAPYVEHVAKTLHATIDTLALPSAYVHVQNRPSATVKVRPMGARLTNANKLRSGNRPSRTAQPKPLPSACRVCGVVLEDASGLYCEDCNPAVQLERERHERERAEREQQARAAEPGTIASFSPSLTKTRAEQRREMLAFDRQYPGVRFDQTVYRERVLPALTRLRVEDIERALGVVRHQAYRYRDGRSIPHARFWEPLARIAGVEDFSLDMARTAVLCAVCGKPASGSIYCSAACRLTARREQERERRRMGREAAGQRYVPHLRARRDAEMGQTSEGA